ncbi:MAG: AzlC family ABC transporter permease [Rhizobiales bacterium]|nr:AzlC family ABC transporter permease [Hyphomicrobiales bacterium]
MKHPTEFWRGCRDGLPVCAAASIFALVFGGVAAERGLSFTEATLMTSLVYAGASQFTALQFWQEPLPYFTIILVVFAINFRHVLYGASLAHKLGNFSWAQRFVGFFFLVDLNFALSEKRFEEGARTRGDVGLTPSYYFGIAALLYPVWVIFSIIGYIFGNLIEDPKVYGLDFILPIYFLTLLFGFRMRSNWVYVVLASGIATFLAIVTVGSPWHISIGAGVGMLVGALIGPKRAVAGSESEESPR